MAEGEPAFRVRERAAVVAALREHDGVLALGGGAVLDAATRADLAAHPVVWLKVSAGVAGSPRRASGCRDRSCWATCGPGW